MIGQMSIVAFVLIILKSQQSHTIYKVSYNVIHKRKQQCQKQTYFFENITLSMEFMQTLINAKKTKVNRARRVCIQIYDTQYLLTGVTLCQIKYRLLQMIDSNCKFTSDFVLITNGVCWHESFKGDKIECGFQNKSVMKYKFLKKIILEMNLGLEFFKVLTQYPYQYLQLLSITSNSINNAFFYHLSRAKWPSLTQLEFISQNHTADGLKVIKKHDFPKLKTIVSCINGVACEKAKRIIQVGTSKALIKFSSKINFSSQNIYMTRFIVSRYIAKRVIIEKYLKERRDINKGKNICFNLLGEKYFVL